MQEFNLLSEQDERKLIVGKLMRMLSSCQINLLIGSAFSLPQLQTLHDVEKDLTAAMEKDEKNDEYKIKRKFFLDSIYPIKTVNFDDLKFAPKRQFLKVLSDIIDVRETSVVHKGINIFSTNYDNFIEVALEKSDIDYFDGFNGRLKPRFSTSNFGKYISKQSSVTGRLSEKVSVNLFKLHGSIFWKEDNGLIVFNEYNERFEKIKSATNQEEFLSAYRELQIVNPEKNKFNSTVMNNNYYDQIRIFSNEIERQNSILIVFGFSFADKHILQIIERALSANPTLTMLLFPYSYDDLNDFRTKFNFYNNVYCYYNMDKDETEIKHFELSHLNELLVEIYNGIK